MTDRRAQNEIDYGRYLAASGNPEEIWNWDTPAGRVRARRRGQLISNAAGLKSGKHIMEIGCGTGLFTEMLAQSGAKILAVDISPDLLAIARRRPLTSTRVDFRQMRFEDSYVDGPFDAIVGSSVLHHLEIVPALRRMYDLLKPGGVIVFAEPNMLNPQIWLERHVGWFRKRYNVSPDETAIVRWRLVRDLTLIGFKEIQIRNVDWLHPRTPKPLIKSVYAAGLILERIPLIKEFTGSVLITAYRPEIN